DSIVQDRYLYVPILGLALVLVPAVFAWSARARWRAVAAGAAGGALILAMACESVGYAGGWASRGRLWGWAGRPDPTAPGAASEYARFLLDSGRLEDARRAASASLAIRPTFAVYLALARISHAQRRHDETERNLRLALALDGTKQTTYELLAMSYDAQG